MPALYAVEIFRSIEGIQVIQQFFRIMADFKWYFSPTSCERNLIVRLRRDGKKMSNYKLIVENGVLTAGGKIMDPYHVLTTLACGSGGNLARRGDSFILPP